MSERIALTKEEKNRRRRERYAENREKINQRRRKLAEEKREKKKRRSEASKKGWVTRRIKKAELERFKQEEGKDLSEEQLKGAELFIKSLTRDSELWEVIESGYWKRFREDYARKKK